ncbi:MAG TPA: FmdB family zinc ribbon protein [Microlunatus sp.]|jgi:putative FmdB family regulatory protein|nr:FmdB family zinc ribbon protein [Microlunatus sp.]
MPTYQYRCTECSNELEAVQKFTDPALTDCPECTGSLRKVFNAVGVVFKGSGFYRTDSRADKKAGAGASTKTEGGSESNEKKSPDASTSSEKASEKKAAKSDTSGGKQPATAGAGSSSGSNGSKGSSTAA